MNAFAVIFFLASAASAARLAGPQARVGRALQQAGATIGPFPLTPFDAALLGGVNALGGAAATAGTGLGGIAGQVPGALENGLATAGQRLGATGSAAVAIASNLGNALGQDFGGVYGALMNGGSGVTAAANPSRIFSAVEGGQGGAADPATTNAGAANTG